MAQVIPMVAPTVEPSATPPNDYQNIQSSPNDFGAQVGQATERLGKTVEQGGLELAGTLQQRYNEVSGNEAVNQYQIRGLQIYDGDPSDPNNQGLKALSGRAALDAVPGAQQSLEDTRQKIRAGLKNDAQRIMFDNDTRRFSLYMRERIGNFDTEQRRVWTSTVNADTERVTLQGIASNPGDDENFKHSLEDVRNAAVKEYQIHDPNHTQPNILSANLITASTAAVKTRIETWATTDPDGAFQWLKNGIVPDIAHNQTGKMVSVREAVDPATYAALYRGLGTKADSSAGKADATDIFLHGGQGAPVPQPTMPGGARVTPVSTSEGAPDVDRVHSAIIQQESSGRDDIGASSAGALGPGQIMPATFAQYAKPGERIDNPADNRAVSKRIVADLYQKYDGDADRVAVAYFSGEGNVAPPGSPTPWKEDKKDTDGTSTSQYVSQVGGRLGGAPRQQQAPADSLYPNEEAAALEISRRAGGNEQREFAGLAQYRKLVSDYRMKTATDRAALERNVGDLKEALIQGVQAPIPEAQIRHLMPPEQAHATIQDLNISAGIGGVIGGMKFASPDDIQETMAGLESGTGTAATLFNLRMKKAGVIADTDTGEHGEGNVTGFKIRQQALGLLRSVVTARQSAIHDDAAGYALTEPTVASAWQTYSQAPDQEKPEAFDAYAQTTRAVQAHLGVADSDQRVLPTQQSMGITKALIGADPAQVDAGAQLDGLAKTYGNRWGDVWHDLVRDGHMPQEWQVLGQMEPGAGRLAMQRALQAANAKGGVEKMRGDVGQQAAQDIDHNINDALADFGKTIFIPGLAGDTSVFNAVHSAVRTLAYWNTLNGEKSSDALEDAVTAALPYDFSGTARAPKGMGATAEATGNAVLRTLETQNLAVPRANMPGLLPKDRDAQYISAVRRSGFWVTNERGDGWVLAVTGLDGAKQFPLDDRGKRIGFRFNQMADVQRQAPASAGASMSQTGGDIGLDGISHQTAASDDTMPLPGSPVSDFRWRVDQEKRNYGASGLEIPTLEGADQVTKPAAAAQGGERVYRAIKDNKMFGSPGLEMEPIGPQRGSSSESKGVTFDRLGEFLSKKSVPLGSPGLETGESESVTPVEAMRQMFGLPDIHSTIDAIKQSIAKAVARGDISEAKGRVLFGSPGLEIAP